MAHKKHRIISTGIPGLDHILEGGLPAEYMYLINGPSGSGKTTLSLQFLMEGVRQGGRSLYIGTAETEEEMDEVACSHGWDLSGVHLRYHGGPAEISGGPEQTMIHPVEMRLPQTMQTLVGMIEKVRPDRLVIDSLTEIRLLSREESWFRDQLKLLEQNLQGSGCTVLLTDLRVDEQPVLRSLVHGVIELDHTSPVYGPDSRRVRIAKIRGRSFCTGSHDMTIEQGGLRVFPRLVAAEHRESHAPQTVSTGLDGLDRMLGGGLSRGTGTLLVGPTGTGKSSLASQMIYAAAERDEKSLMVIFDERIQTVLRRSASLGVPLEDHVNSGLVQIQQIDPAELTPGQFSRQVAVAVEDDVKTVVIDSLNGYAYAMPEEGLLELYLHELLSFLSQKGVTSIQVMTQHGVFRQQESVFDVSYIADTVLLLRLFEFQGSIHKCISVHKKRTGHHEKTIREFDLNEGKISIGGPLDRFTGLFTGNPKFVGDSLTQNTEES